MKSYRALAIKELFAQRVTSVLVLIAVILSTMMTTIVGQSLGVLTAMREQQAIALGGNRYATFLQMDADQLHALQQDERLSYVGASIYLGSMELTSSLNLGLTEYQGDNASIYPSSTNIKEGKLPQAPMELALPEDVLQYLGFDGNIGDMRKAIRRGDLFYADLNPVVGSEQGGIRPVLVIQNDVGNHFSPTVVAAAITSRKAKNSLPTHILLENVPGLAPTSLLLLEQLRTIDRQRLRGYIGRISKEKMLEIDAALAISIGIGYPNERRTHNV